MIAKRFGWGGVGRAVFSWAASKKRLEGTEQSFVSLVSGGRAVKSLSGMHGFQTEEREQPFLSGSFNHHR